MVERKTEETNLINRGSLISHIRKRRDTTSIISHIFNLASNKHRFIQFPIFIPEILSTLILRIYE